MTQAPRAKTSSGTLAGQRADRDGAPFLSWRGIPYASVPHGGRFLPAQPVRAPGARRDCTLNAPSAPQIQDPDDLSLERHGQSESDCLSLNVWAPPEAQDAPVLVWLHGGAFQWGANSDAMAAGDVFAAEHGIIVVTASYRLGALGFLAVDQLLGSGYGASGALALDDQIAALRWVQENIAAFGGDPDRVTIGGASAGGTCTSLLLTSPPARGLFQRAIVQSGPARWQTPTSAHAQADRFLAALDVPTSRASELVSLPAEWLLAAQHDLQQEAADAEPSDRSAPFVPMMGSLDLPLSPAEVFRAGEDADVPVLIGTSRNEAAFFMDRWADGAEDDPRDRAQRICSVAGISFDDFAAAASTLDEEGTPRDAEGLDLLEALLTEIYYHRGSQAILDARASRRPMFSYLFSWPSDSRPHRKSSHSMEVPFVFGHLDSPERPDTIGPTAPHELSAAMTSAWAAFIRCGDPSTPQFAWPRYGTERAVAIFDRESRIEHDPRRPLREFWATSGLDPFAQPRTDG